MTKFSSPPRGGPNQKQHGVDIIDDDEDFESSPTFVSIDFKANARTEKEKWLAYKNNAFVAAGRGKRRSLGLAPQKLLSLSFDPIEAKVMLAEKYEAELAYHEALREGLILNPSTGKPRSYSAQAHALVMTAYDRCINDLMRYGYARVPEKEEDIGSEIPPVTISLTLSEEDIDETIEEANKEGLIENSENIRDLAKEQIRKLQVPVKLFSRDNSEGDNEY